MKHTRRRRNSQTDMSVVHFHKIIYVSLVLCIFLYANRGLSRLVPFNISYFVLALLRNIMTNVKLPDAGKVYFFMAGRLQRKVISAGVNASVTFRPGTSDILKHGEAIQIHVPFK